MRIRRLHEVVMSSLLAIVFVDVVVFSGRVGLPGRVCNIIFRLLLLPVRSRHSPRGFRGSLSDTVAPIYTVQYHFQQVVSVEWFIGREVHSEVTVLFPFFVRVRPHVEVRRPVFDGKDDVNIFASN